MLTENVKLDNLLFETSFIQILSETDFDHMAFKIVRNQTESVYFYESHFDTH